MRDGVTTTRRSCENGQRVPKLTPEERNTLKASGIFDERPDALCQDCGGFHLRACPRVKSQEWLGNGNRVKVEYFAEWDESSVIFTEDVYDLEEEQDDRAAPGSIH
jgi:hypothetical protein